VETSDGELLLRWDLLSQVTPGLSTSGYQIYLKREGWNAFQPWSSFHARQGSTSHLPLLQEENSLVDGRMEVWVVDLPNGKIHWLYVTGVQNGHEGPPSPVVSDVPFRLCTNIVIRDEAGGRGDWYVPGFSEADPGTVTMDRVGYLHDSGSHFLRFLPAEAGGWLRVLNAGAGAGKQDAPTDASGAPTGFHDDPSLDRIEIAEGDYVFVWNTAGTAERADDHFARLWIENVVDVSADRRIKLECAYQPRANTPNL
jgi:hypothetical protein